MSDDKVIPMQSNAVGQGGCSMMLMLGFDPDGKLTLTVRAGIKKLGLSAPQIAELKHQSDVIDHMLKLFMKDKGVISQGGTLEPEEKLELLENPVIFVEMLVNKMRHNPMEWDQVKRYMLNQLSGVKFRKLTNDEVEEACKS